MLFTEIVSRIAEINLCDEKTANAIADEMWLMGHICPADPDVDDITDSTDLMVDWDA